MALDSAASLAKTEDEKYLIAYNRAIVYYNRQDYEKALTFANQAKNIKPGENIEELISDIYKLK